MDLTTPANPGIIYTNNNKGRKEKVTNFAFEVWGEFTVPTTGLWEIHDSQSGFTSEPFEAKKGDVLPHGREFVLSPLRFEECESEVAFLAENWWERHTFNRLNPDTLDVEELDFEFDEVKTEFNKETDELADREQDEFEEWDWR